MEIDEKERLSYSLGGLLYAPAMNVKVVQKVRDGVWKNLKSLAFCLEDTIKDECLEEAQMCLKEVLRGLAELDKAQLPLIFIRIRTPEHMKKAMKLYEEYKSIITGYILPKFDLSNSDEYIELIKECNADRNGKTTYIMPIFESRMIADVVTRVSTLARLKECLDSVKDYVLNVRVGGNDFCNLYGVRRSVNQTIYDIGVIRDIFVDIINIFGADYVVSGPVWEYFGTSRDGRWDRGLINELELDRLNGFIGKTAIHPVQLPVIFDSMKVKKSDYDDAMSILNWNNGALGVAKSENGTRMNEVKVHGKWARKIAILGEIYGIKEDRNENMVKPLVQHSLSFNKYDEGKGA